MRIIGDDGFMGDTYTTCLGIDWGIRRCNIKGCDQTILARILVDTDAGTIGICRDHWDWMEANQITHIDLEFTPIDWVGPDDEYAVEWRMSGGES
jgi:hypothetical protein